MKGTVLVAGFATRHVVQSAFHAGYTVFAVDHFCDRDLCMYTRDRRTFEDLDEILPAIDEILSEYPIDIFVVTSGAEELRTSIPRYGTPIEIAEKFLDKLSIQAFFEEIGVLAPPLITEIGTPCILKPRKGAGGWRNRIVHQKHDIEAWVEEWPDTPYICQQLVNGTPCSVSCIASGGEARAIATNEQFLRSDSERAFGFSGAITPFVHPEAPLLIASAEKIAAESGCVGSVGIDFILGSEPWAIEINPRFQATLDTVEIATGCNLFDLHIRACRGILPPRIPNQKRFGVRKIVFAERDLKVNDDLMHLAPAVADIPWMGTELEEGHAVMSAYGWGPSRVAALQMLDKTIKKVGRYMSRW